MKKLNIEYISKSVRKIFTYFEGFGGIGAQSASLKRLEKMLNICFKCVGIAEIEPHALAVYEKLNGAVKNFGDITKIDFKKLPHFDFITWSSPCQDASSAGQRKGFKEGSGTRSSLAWYLIPLLKAKQVQNDLPLMICFENVLGILQGENKKTFDEFLEAIKKFGYVISYQVLDANDYGTAQHRERVFVICSLIDVGFEFPKPRKERVLLKDILDKDIDPKYYYNSTNPITRSLYSGKGRTLRIHNSNSPHGYTLSTHGTGRPEDNYFFINDFGNVPVVRANLKFMTKHKLSIDELYKAQIRSITPNEAIRLMGFNEEEMELILKANLPKTWLYYVLGNSICPPVLEDIFFEYFKRVLEMK